MDMSRQPHTGTPLAPGADGTAGLRLQSLGKKFDEFVAVRDIDLHIRRGEFLTLLAPSGSPGPAASSSTPGSRSGACWRAR